MTPDQFLRQLQKQGPSPAYLFLGPDYYMRDQCRRALIQSALPEEDREQGFSQHDLDDEELAPVLDDARTLSLFATHRVIWISSAEGALPRGRAAAAADEDEPESSVKAKAKDGAALVADYVGILRPAPWWSSIVAGMSSKAKTRPASSEFRSTTGP